MAVVRAAAKLDVVDGSLTAGRPWHDVVEFQESFLLAAAAILGMPDLRREKIHANIILRSQVISSLRRRMTD